MDTLAQPWTAASMIPAMPDYADIVLPEERAAMQAWLEETLTAIRTTAVPAPLATLRRLRRHGFDGATAYQYCMDGGQNGDYVVWANQAISRWPDYEAMHGTYYPHVSAGWDNTHRNPSFKQESVVVNATPDAFEACLWKAKAWLDARPNQTPLVTINSWNEWTEGSYLLPDKRWGYGYLRAVRNVFGIRR